MPKLAPLRNLISKARRLFVTGKPKPQPYNTQFHYTRLAYEIRETITRDTVAKDATELVELVNFCPPVTKAIRVFSGDLFSSYDGTDIGVRVHEELEDGTAIDPEIIEIGNNLFRSIPVTIQKLIAKRMLGYGDCFVEPVIAHDGGTNYHIQSLNVLPTWTMERLETEQGQLVGFQQRIKQMGDEVITFRPPQIVHFRYDLEYLYGRSVFHSCVPLWRDMKSAAIALAEAIQVSINPIRHTFPNHYTKKQRDDYVQARIREKAEGILTEIFHKAEIEVERMTNGGAGLESQLKALQYYRTELRDQSGLPSWNWLDEKNQGAKDLGGMPSLTYSRFIAEARGNLTEGFRQILDMELILRGRVTPEQRQFRLKWPMFAVKPETQDEQNEENDSSSAIEPAKDTEEARYALKS